MVIRIWYKGIKPLGGPFYVDGFGPVCYTKACDLVGKRVETGPLGIILQASLCANVETARNSTAGWWNNHLAQQIILQ